MSSDSDRGSCSRAERAGPTTVHQEPRLHFSNRDLKALLETGRFRLQPGALLLVDWFNAPVASHFDELATVHVVRDSTADEIRRVSASGRFNQIVAVGGCSTLDFGRMCANFADAAYTAVPSILSTACISVDHSVVYSASRGGNLSFQPAKAPDEVVVSYALLENAGVDELRKWCASGVGDLLARISGVVEESSGTDPTPGDLLQLAPECFAVQDWLAVNFDRWDRRSLRRLAEHLHSVSLRTAADLREGHKPTAGEHDLYYAMKSFPGYSRDKQTHGRLVAIGTLLSVHALASADRRHAPMYARLRQAYAKVDLPTTVNDLRKIGVQLKEIVLGLESIQDQASYLANSFTRHGDSLVRGTFR
jgi:glycerol dehydrogenase-like iron-containing ADH family enzyme